MKAIRELVRCDVMNRAGAGDAILTGEGCADQADRIVGLPSVAGAGMPGVEVTLVYDLENEGVERGGEGGVQSALSGLHAPIIDR